MRFVIGFLLGLLVTFPAWAAYDSATAATSTTLSILRVTPTGDNVPDGKQIVIQFNRPVVPLGRMERTAAEVPATFVPALNCQWRWLNTSALACNLDDKDKLHLATVYKMVLKRGIKAEDGTTISEDYHHSFTTQLPTVCGASLKNWTSPVKPVFRVTFNQPVTLTSVKRALSLKADGGKVYQIDVSPDPTERQLPGALPLPGTHMVAVLGDTKPQKSDDAKTKVNGKEARRIWIVVPARNLPADTAMQLMMSLGLVSSEGPERGNVTRKLQAFSTFPAFRFMGISCVRNGEREMVNAADLAKADPCEPLSWISMVFSSPVERKDIGKNLAFSPSIRIGNAPDPWGEDSDNADDNDEDSGGDVASVRGGHNVETVYSINLPTGLKSNATYQVSLKPSSKLTDSFGRPLEGGLAISFRTGHRKVNVDFPNRVSVLESQISSDVPLYVTNVSSASISYHKLTPEGASGEVSVTRQMPNVADIQYAVPMGVRSLLGSSSGALYGTVDTSPSFFRGDSPHFFAEVTPYQVHVKLGHYNSLAWVTDLASGKPVEGAKVTVYIDSPSGLEVAKTPTLTVQTDKDGVAIFDGSEKLDPDLTLNGWDENAKKLFVRIDKGRDMAVMPLNRDFAINSYRAVGGNVYPEVERRNGHITAWGTTAQGIYRAGDTIQFKIYVRNEGSTALTPAPKAKYQLQVTDPTDNKVYVVKDLTLDKFGAYAGEFKVGEQGAVGWYQFQLSANFSETAKDKQDTEKTFKWQPMRVLVTDFTPMSFKVSTQVNGSVFQPSQTVEMGTHATLHSGGDYANADMRATAMLRATPFRPTNPQSQDFSFGISEYDDTQQKIFQSLGRIDGHGSNTVSFSMPQPNKITYGNLMFESAVKDERGKLNTAQATAHFAGRDRYVGVRITEWIYPASKAMPVEWLVTDVNGAPVAGTQAKISLEKQETKAARVKGAGNAYLTEYKNSWEERGACNGVSAVQSQTCQLTPPTPGYYRAVALIKDTKGREYRTEHEFYVTGAGYVLWNDDNESDLQVIPEKTSWKVGDTARFMVKNPYPGARALVTTERYGVLKHWVQTLDGSTPVISVPITIDDSPGFYLSVVVFSPRVDKPVANQVDLGKPTYRMGYVTVPVNDTTKQIRVSATTNLGIYKPGDKVKLTLSSNPGNGEPVQYAVAVLDESFLDLIANGTKNFDPYAGFYSLKGLDLRNYSLLTRLLGRQNFEKKGANPGGDGGNAGPDMRGLFKFVSYWNPALTADARGNAQVEFTAPDNLTGWRVLALAATPTDRMGLGEGTFKVNRDTEIRPVMPNQVSEGDSFSAGFSVMNRTDQSRTIVVKMSASGNVTATSKPELETTLQLAPYQRQVVRMPLQTTSIGATRKVSSGEITFAVTAGDKKDADGLRYSLPVYKRRALQSVATYGTTTANAVSESIAFPTNMHGDVGELSLTVFPSVIGNLGGAFTYARDYKYNCWEQQLTRALMAAYYMKLKPYMPSDVMWDDAGTTPAQVMAMASMFQAPNGGMAYFFANDEYADPYLSAYTALAFNMLRKEGYAVPGAVEERLHDYLQNFLKHDNYPDYYGEDMVSTVRAVALAALAQDGKVTLSDLERYHPQMQKMSLFGKTFMLEAALNVSGSTALITEGTQQILAHSDQSGGKFTFSETLDDSFSRILSSPLRENCAILDTFIKLGERPEGKDLVGDVPYKLVRMITQARGSKTHWNNTQEDVFCMGALTDYARIYENVTPKMKVSASLDTAKLGEAVYGSLRDSPTTFEHAITPQDPGRKMKLGLTRSGDGRVYYAARINYAPLKESGSETNAGIEVHREYSVERGGKWQLLKSPFAISPSELVRVDLYLSLPAAREYVVVDDPVPGGLEPVNRDLATTSKVDADKAGFDAAGGSIWFQFKDWVSYNVSRWSFYHQELRNNSARFYADYLPAGNYHLSYAAQAISPGTFAVMPVKAQEMYDPDVYGQGASEELRVSP